MRTCINRILIIITNLSVDFQINIVEIKSVIENSICCHLVNFQNDFNKCFNDIVIFQNYRNFERFTKKYQNH